MIAQLKKARPEELLNFGRAHRLPMIMQTEVAECGLACLAMIAGYHGFDTDLLHLRKHYVFSSKGANLKHIMHAATAMHLMPRALRVEPENLHHVQLPCILHWGLNHFVVLKSLHKNTFAIHDPAFGERVITKSEFDKEFTGVALELIPSKEFTKGEQKQPLTLAHFWSNIVGLKRSLANVLILSLLLQLFALISPFYMQTVVDDVLLRKDTHLLLVLALGFGLLMLIQVGTNLLREWIILTISNRLSIQMASNLFRHLIRLPMDYFSKRHMGDIVSRFGSLSKIRELLTHSLVAAVIDGLMAVITLIAMFFYSATLAFMVMAVVLIYGALRWFFFRPFRRLTEESIIAGAKENSHFMESIRAIQTIKLFQREQDRQHQWQNRLADVMNKNIHIAKWGMAYTTLNGILFGIENVLVIYMAATAVMGNIMSLGMLYAFISYKTRFISAMDSLIAQWIELKMLDLHLARLADIAFTDIENIDEQLVVPEDHALLQQSHTSNANHASDNLIELDFLTKKLHKKIVGKIEVKNLSYKYSEHEPYIFKDLNFVIHPGETVAITGASGCGKTTLLKCLMGLITPTEGEIFIDDKPLTQLTHYRSQIAGVMQEDQLLSGDIAENICCFAPQQNTEKIYVNAQMACIHNDILKMPMQYNTLVGDMGSSLSGGQKQRLILARALYREPRILFMDEATSHLDIDNELLVNEHIRQLNITRVLVAHRPETVRSAGREISLVGFSD